MSVQLWQLRRKVHQSWLIAICSAGIVVGAALIPHISQTFFGSSAWFVVGILLVAISLVRQKMYMIPFVIVAGLVIGLWRGSILESQLSVYGSIIGQNARVQGTVSDDPDSGKKGEVLLRLTNLTVTNRPVPGKIWASLKQHGDLKRGDQVTLEGKLSTGFGGFAAVMYQAKVAHATRPEPGDVARQVRDWFADTIRIGLHEPQASLGLGYLLGQRRALPPELTQALVVTGLTHVVVASGYNLTILVRLARRLFVKVSKYLAALSASAMIVAFISITGASPSMSRAGLVAGLSLAAWYYGRRFHPLVLLPFAAAITIIIDPTYAWNDLGWQLSFAAFAGVMILAPLLQRYFFGDRKPGIIRQILGETVSASIMTMPILILAFGQFSNVAIITNLLILPLVPVAMLLTFIGGVGTVFIPSAASIISAPAQLLLTYMTAVIDYFSAISWAQTILTIQPWVAWASYGLIGAGCLYLWRATNYDLKESNLIE
jgi:competence protein ComEC